MFLKEPFRKRLLYGRCSILGLDMNETTMLAWRMEECDEFYFCSSVIYVVMAQHQVLDSLAALLRNASMRTPFDQIDICIAGMTDLCAPEFDDRFDARLPVREAAKHLVRAGSNARTGLAGARRMQIL